MLGRLRFALRALRHRDLRLFFSGQVISLVGRWMQSVAVGWLVYRLTGSPFWLGAIGFASQFPTFLMAPIGGALADRWNRYRIVVFAQVVSMFQAAVMALIVLTGAVEVWHLVALSALLGLASGLDIPARHALLVRLVGGPNDLPNAIALNSAMFNAARLVGPAVAGILIGWIGEGPVFLLNAVSYLPVLAALVALGPGVGGGVRRRSSVVGAMREGFRYAWGFPPVRDVLLVLALISLVGIPYATLLPAFARDVLGGDARTLGLLTSAAGLGALLGTLRLAARSSVRGLGRVVASSTALFGAGLIGFSLSQSSALSAGCMLVVGFGVVNATASINTILQTLVDEDIRGRVMSLYTMAFMGMSPVGSLLAGSLAGRFGAPATIAVGGSVCGLVALGFATRIPALRELVHPVYVERGILPEVATGLNSASELRPRS